ncbi:DUF6318 family protein [Arthrobacter sp. SDTb3-6]|uniref:DUF6318 family protein n=1 Tax=Arthrobacter sp. SDTb3-6 TaxID=2713571 RepID=UPI00159E86BF|nr:hypothetical protein [Arthrobacter sp. SDTb3-6]
MALAAVLALAGCGTDSPPNRAPSPASASATGAAPPTTAAPTTPPIPVYKPATANGPAQNVPVPVLPAKAKEFSKAGLEAFATYWYSTLGYVYETGDSKPMMAITGNSCSTCERTNGPVGDWYRSGGWITGGRLKVHSATSSFEHAADGSYQAIVIIEQSPVSYYSADGTLDEALAPTIARPDIVVATYSNARWTAETAEHLTSQ